MKRLFYLIFAAFFLIISCESVKALLSPAVVSDEYNQMNFYTTKRVFTDEHNPEFPDGHKYIFVRLYSPVYKETISAENLLKFLIGTTRVSDIDASHASIGFNLEDSFAGYTSYKIENYQLNFEECTDITTNPYMIKANPDQSLQITYALKVSREEYDNAMKMVNDYLSNPDAHYSIQKNFLIAGKSIRRKFLLEEDKQSLKEQGNNFSSIDENPEEEDFVCSSFVAYVLVNNVKSIRNFFDACGLNYNLITPSDLAEFPGMIEICRSTWSDCDYSGITLE